MRGSRVLAALAVLVLVACGDDGEAPWPEQPRRRPQPERFAGGDFYAPPEPLPDGEPGDLLRYEPMVDVAIAGGTVWRVMYLSESLQGDPIAVTGMVVVPAAPAPAGGRPLVTVANWSMGIADECAGSHDPMAVGLPLSTPFVTAGYVVAQSDYEGLGTPGRHPWLVGESEGRSVLDAAKAAAQLPEAAVGDRYAIVGYSQGGHAALWANQLAADWGPDLELVGTVAGAPVTELPAAFAQQPSVTGFYLSMVAGYAAAYPEADPALLLTEEGLAALDLVDQGCTREVYEAVAALGSTPLVRTDQISQVWVDLLEQNNPGQVATDAPVLILHSLTDELLSATLSEQLFERLCAVGQVVERRTYDAGQSHISAAPEVYRDAFAWVQGLMDGTSPARSTCPLSPAPLSP